MQKLLGGHHLERNGRQLAGLVALAALLFMAGAVGLAYVAGFHAVRQRLIHPHWPWLVASAAVEIVSFAGYLLAYRGLSRVEKGPDLRGKPLLAVVASGFGGFLAQGGGALDHYVMKATGASDREAAVRVSALGGLEHGSIPWIVCPTAIALLIIGVHKPPGDFTLPWAVIPPIGFLAGVAAAEHWRDELRGRDGWRGKMAVFFDGVHYVWMLFRHPIRYDAAVIGMLVFWGADMFSLWAGMAAFGFHMTAGALILAYGTGYVLTQRTAPLGGAGLLMVILPPTIMYCGAPLAAAVLGVFAHRFFSLWLFMPAAFAGLPTLRALGRAAPDTPGEGTSETQGEPALEH
ncbi:MAG TPA: hypothetical protein VE992_01440 [Solirubrobacteraceae bacterium]|nr:hypothetical protein [Solirubrobacteraceae bacterium]